MDVISDELNAGALFDAMILDITIRGGMGAQETLPKLGRLGSCSKGDHLKRVLPPVIVDYRSFGYAAAIVKPNWV